MRTRKAISALISAIGKRLREQYDANPQPTPERLAQVDVLYGFKAPVTRIRHARGLDRLRPALLD